jgi:hypothetical protein
MFKIFVHNKFFIGKSYQTVEVVSLVVVFNLISVSALIILFEFNNNSNDKESERLVKLK